MMDTIRAHWPEKACHGCEATGDVVFLHWGPFVPDGQKLGYFCSPCMTQRSGDPQRFHEMPHEFLAEENL